MVNVSFVYQSNTMNLSTWVLSISFNKCIGVKIKVKQSKSDKKKISKLHKCISQEHVYHNYFT